MPRIEDKIRINGALSKVLGINILTEERGVTDCGMVRAETR